jgi:DNA-directed RNA polymerase subunit H
MKFNVLQHKLVPEHRLMTDEETKRVLATLRITKDQLPKIKKADPAIKVLEKAKCPCHPDREFHGPIEEGTILKVTRLSETAGVSEAYRLVIGR